MGIIDQNYFDKKVNKQNQIEIEDNENYTGFFGFGHSSNLKGSIEAQSETDSKGFDKDNEYFVERAGDTLNIYNESKQVNLSGKLDTSKKLYFACDILRENHEVSIQKLN